MAKSDTATRQKAGYSLIWKMESVPLYWSVVFSITAVKFLLISSYRSTDFEVHRHWLAITHNLKRDKWYYDETSRWTLDYPPFFAWFECALSYVAAQVDPAMLRISNLNYASWCTVVFMRTSVIFTDILYAYAVYRCCRSISRFQRRQKVDVWADDLFIICMLLMTNVGLLMLDHIHFQYNGFLYGLLLLSINCALEDKNLQAAFWFATLLNFKHVFLYMAPAYFVYLLRNCCFKAKSSQANWKNFQFISLMKLGAIVGSVFSCSFLPFVVHQNHLRQILSRLFPFKRGLTHAYWAPNFWAIYNFVDNVFTVVGMKFNLLSAATCQTTTTRGLVEEYKHCVLPSVTPWVTFMLAGLFMLPSLYSLWTRPNQPWELVRSAILCAFSSFMFGWHVHEKAVLMMIIPLSLLVLFRDKEARLYLMLSTVGHFSIMPLLFQEAESPTKLLMFVLFASYAFFSLSLKFSEPVQFILPLLSIGESVYLFGLFFLQLYNGLFHWMFGLGDAYPFLPLVLTSVHCSAGIVYVFVQLHLLSWNEPLVLNQVKSR